MGEKSSLQKLDISTLFSITTWTKNSANYVLIYILQHNWLGQWWSIVGGGGVVVGGVIPTPQPRHSTGYLFFILGVCGVF